MESLAFIFGPLLLSRGSREQDKLVAGFVLRTILANRAYLLPRAGSTSGGPLSLLYDSPVHLPPAPSAPAHPLPPSAFRPSAPSTAPRRHGGGLGEMSGGLGGPPRGQAEWSAAGTAVSAEAAQAQARLRRSQQQQQPPPSAHQPRAYLPPAPLPQTLPSRPRTAAGMPDWVGELRRGATPNTITGTIRDNMGYVIEITGIKSEHGYEIIGMPGPHPPEYRLPGDLE